MEKVIVFKRSNKTMKECAQYVLDHEYWLPLLRNRQAYYRDFVLEMVRYRIRFGIDDTLIPSIVQEMADSGYLWDIFNNLKKPERVAHAVMSSVLSVQSSGHYFSAETFKPVFRVIAESLRGREWVPFALAEDDDVMHPLVVAALLENPQAADRLISMSNAGIKDALLALSALDDDLTAPLLSGAL
jgi:hypothetical protein